MKKLIAFILICVSAKLCFAAWGDEFYLNKASFTKTNETTVVIPNTLPGTVFVGVVVSSSVGGGTVTFYDSSGTATTQLGLVSMAGTANGAYYVPFEIRLSSGLTYTTAGNTVGVTIVYKITRP